MGELHTPTPWIEVPQGNGSNMIARQFETGNQMQPTGLRLVAHVLARGDSLKEDQANAAFIVRACNSHDALVKALLVAKETFEGIVHETGDGLSEDALIVVNAALAAATTPERE